MGWGDFLDVKNAATGGVSLIVGVLVKWLSGLPAERRQIAAQKKAEQAETAAQGRQDAAERELCEIKRRAESPMLLLATEKFLFAEPYSKEVGETMEVSWDDAASLVPGTSAVPEDFIKGNFVLLYVEMHGAKPRTFHFDLDGEEAFLSDDVAFLHYYYDPSKREKAQKLIFSFELETGVIDRHTYEIIHGFRQLRRIHPPGV